MFKEKYLNLASLENWISKWNTSSSIPFPRLLLPILIRWLNFWVYQQKKNETYQDHFLIKHAKLNHQLTYLLYAPCHIESDEKVLDSRIQYLLEQQKLWNEILERNFCGFQALFYWRLVENKTLILLLSNDHVTKLKLKGVDTCWFQFWVPSLYFVLCNA